MFGKKKKDTEIEKKVKEYREKLIKEEERKNVLFNASLQEYLQELVNNVSRKNVKVRISRPNGETIEIHPIEKDQAPAVILPEEIY